MSQLNLLDTQFGGMPGVIAVFVLETQAGLILIETGPESTFQNIQRSMAAHNWTAADVRHVLVTHIHFDHAGAAWRFAEAGAQIHVHERGARHLIEPGKLVASARQIYGDQMGPLWGEFGPIPSEKVHVMRDGEVLRFDAVEIRAINTPGHAPHHLAYRWEETIFTGDVAGVSLRGGPVVPPLPPPDIDLETWENSLRRLESEEARSFYLTHFGKVEDTVAHLQELRERLVRWPQWIRERMSAPADDPNLIRGFEQFVWDDYRRSGLDDAGIAAYETADPAFMSVAGLHRYWRKREQRTGR